MSRFEVIEWFGNNGFWIHPTDIPRRTTRWGSPKRSNGELSDGEWTCEGLDAINGNTIQCGTRRTLPVLQGR